MTIAREEIFGPAICIMEYRDEEEAIAIANDTVFGLGARVSSGDLRHARRVAARLRFGGVVINYAPHDWRAPFGGFKQSGNGRAYADFGIAEYVDMKSVIGYGDA
jgi:aldehyde dehydrogenase (NAD+)